MPSTDSNVRKQKYDTGITLGRPSPRSIFFPYPQRGLHSCHVLPTEESTMSYDYILHVSDVARWPAALSNLGNLTQLGLAHGITVIVNGTGVYALQGANDWTAQMEAAAHAGVDFFACARSLANHEFVEGTLPEWLGQVPAAIPAIREWTKDGATYIKP